MNKDELALLDQFAMAALPALITKGAHAAGEIPFAAYNVEFTGCRRQSA